MSLENISTKNIVFVLEDMAHVKKWLENIISDVYLHLVNDFEGKEPGTYQVVWELNKVNKEE